MLFLIIVGNLKFSAKRRNSAIAKESQVNEQIKDREVRLIGADGNQLGIVPTVKALQMAMDEGLDLVKIAQTPTESVCKIMDYGKYKFEQTKKEKELKKNQKVVEIKEIRLSVVIDTHDFEIKLKQALKFLAEGNKVKLSVRMVGRQLANPQKGIDIINRFIAEVGANAIVDKPAERLSLRNVIAVIAPPKK